MVWSLGLLLFLLSVYFFPWRKEKKILLLFVCHVVTASVLMIQTKMALGVLLLLFGIFMSYFWMFLVQHMGVVTEKEKKIKVNTRKVWIKFVFSLGLGLCMFALLRSLKIKEDQQEVLLESNWLRLMFMGIFLSLVLMNRKMTWNRVISHD